MLPERAKPISDLRERLFEQNIGSLSVALPDPSRLGSGADPEERPIPRTSVLSEHTSPDYGSVSFLWLRQYDRRVSVIAIPLLTLVPGRLGGSEVRA